MMMGYTTLHCACSTTSSSSEEEESESDIRYIVEKNPLLIQQQDSDGSYPLHIVCQYNQSLSVIRYLIDLYPTALSEKNDKDQYSLHYTSIGIVGY